MTTPLKGPMSVRCTDLLPALVAFALASLLAGAGPLPAQTTAPLPHPPQFDTALEPGDTVLATPEGRYEAGWLTRWVMGEGHRSLWSIPVPAQVLDLEVFAGGLTPIRLGGGQQTRSLRFRGADGHTYHFRSIDKEGARTLDPLLRESLAADILEDRVSALFPLSAMVVGDLLDAVGILHPNPRLAVLPDDPRLGEYREEFAGMLGWIEERPDEVDDGDPGFAGSDRVVGSDRLLERLEERHGNRVDARTYLRARLVDVLVGDWDRHPDQWRWAGFDSPEGLFVFQAVPRDRDWALTRLDGLTALFTRFPWPHYVGFSDEFPSAFRATWSARALDRRILPLLSWEEWEEEALDLQRALTDQVIEDAVYRLPVSYRERVGNELARSLRLRRDDLLRFTREYYELQAGWVDLETTDDDELVRLERTDSGTVRLEIRSLEGVGWGPYLTREFLPGETHELRLDLHGGDDRVQIVGSDDGSIRIRIDGGGGDDSYRVGTDGDRIHLYDHRGDNDFQIPPGVEVDTRDWDDPVDSRENTHGAGYRSWGDRWIPLPAFSFGPDDGLFLGAGARWTRFGFRHYPYHTRLEASLGMGTGTGRARLQGTLDLPFVGADTRSRIQLLASGAEFGRYYGLGNETSDDGPRDTFRARRREFSIQGSVGWTPDPELRIDAGLLFRTLRPDEEPGSLVAQEAPYGFSDFDLAGVETLLTLDRRDDQGAPRSGYRLRLRGRWIPELMDARSSYGSVSGVATAYLSADDPSLEPSLAFRLGGEHLFGDFPFFDAAYLGGRDDLRGYRNQRFAGRSSVFGSTELRVRLADFLFLLPGEVGLLAHGDAGRVFIDDEDSSRIHGSLGGGIWVDFVEAYTGHLTVAASREGTLVYVGLGLPF